MSYSSPSRIAPSAMRMSVMPSTLKTSARIASPPGNTGRRSSVMGSSASSRTCPASMQYSMARVMPAGVMRCCWGSSAWITSPMARTAPECRLHRLELQARSQACALEAPCRDLAVAEEPLALRHAAHLQALELERREPLADDELGAAATDVDHQAPPGLARHGVRDAGVDEARLLHASNDLDGMTERLAGALQEGLLAVRNPQRVGADDAHAVGVHVAQPLPEALQARQGARRNVLIDAAVLGDAGGQAHHLAQAVDDYQLAVRVARDHHVEAVGAQVHRGQHVRHGAA